MGPGNLVRVPSLGHEPGGAFPRVWTTEGRTNQGFSFASSMEPVDRSGQMLILSMADGPANVLVRAPARSCDMAER